MVVIIADDLTGANDTGVQYKKNGFSTMVQTEFTGIKKENLKQYDVLSVNANSRLLSPEKAYKRVYDVASQLYNIHPEYIYKKIDSLLRGNPAAELDAVMDATGIEMAVVVPSFPENNRKLIDGILEAPGSEKINVVKIFEKGSKRNVCSVKLKDVNLGSDNLCKFMDQKHLAGYEVFVIDASNDKNLEAIKNAVKAFSQKIICCGSAGFARQLSNDKKEKEKTERNSESDGPVIVVAGSRRIETKIQLQAVSKKYGAPIIKMDVLEAENITSRNETIEQCADKIIQLAGNDQKLILFAVSSLFFEANNGQQAKIHDRDTVHIVEALGETMKIVAKHIKFKAVVSTGGDTSLQICHAFRSIGIELCDEIAPGIPTGRLVGGDEDSLLIVTKSGGFGSADALIQIIEYLDKIM